METHNLLKNLIGVMLDIFDLDYDWLALTKLAGALK